MISFAKINVSDQNKSLSQHMAQDFKYSSRNCIFIAGIAYQATHKIRQKLQFPAIERKSQPVCAHKYLSGSDMLTQGDEMTFGQSIVS